MTSQPRDWCSPKTSFGRLVATERVWLAPDPDGEPLQVSKFRAAVMQHVIALAIRGHKNENDVAQEDFSRRDLRLDSTRMWNARLCGRAYLTTQDLAALIMILPGAMPDEEGIRTFIEVAEGTRERPKFWDFPDVSSRRPKQ